MLTEVDLSRLAVIAFLHDIGKANSGFQGRYWTPADPESRWWPRSCGHGPEGWELISPRGMVAPADRILQGLPLEAMAEWGDESVLSLLQASISHHGRPVSDGQPASNASWQPVRMGTQLRYDPANTVAAIGRRLLQLYPAAFKATSAAPVQCIPNDG